MIEKDHQQIYYMIRKYFLWIFHRKILTPYLSIRCDLREGKNPRGTYHKEIWKIY